MKLASSSFEKLANGKKIIESRLYDEKRQKINVGDQIEFTRKDNPSKKALVKVKAVYLYSSFDELFSDFPLEYFGANSKQRLLKEVDRFYSRDEQEKYGVIGIKMKVVQ